MVNMMRYYVIAKIGCQELFGNNTIYRYNQSKSEMHLKFIKIQSNSALEKC